MLPIVLLKRLTGYHNDFGVERRYFRSLWFYSYRHDDFVREVGSNNPVAYTFKEDMSEFLTEK